MITARQDAFPARQAPIPAIRGFHGRQPSTAARCVDQRGCGGQAATASPAHRGQRHGSTDRQGSFATSLSLGGFRRFDLVMLAQDLLDLGRVNSRIILERVIADLGEVFGGKLFLGAGHLQRLHFNGHDANHRPSGHVGIAADQVAPNLAALASGPVLSLRSAARLVPLGCTIGIGGDDDMGHRLGGFAGNQVQNIHLSSPCFDILNIGPMALIRKREFAGNAADRLRAKDFKPLAASAA